MLTCLNNDDNIFDIDDILVNSITSMLADDGTDEGGKDEKDNDDNDAAANDDNERLSLLTMVLNATWWTDLTRGASRAGR